MEPETSGSAAPSPSRKIFFNDRGLRAGWRLLIFVLVAVGLPRLLLWAILRLGHSQTSAGPEPSEILPWLQLAFGCLSFLWLLFVTWIMSRIERRPVGSYGLPLVSSALPRFVSGYILWGFIPITVALLALRACGVFFFGGLTLHGWQILGWGAIWTLAFLTVGLVEEFSFRGYVLQTLAEGIGFWPAAIILALGFGYVHMGNPGESRMGIAAAALFALFAATTIWRTGNLWLAVGAHAGWDWGQSFFYGVSDSGFQAPGHLLNPHVSQGPDWLTGGTVGPEGSVVTLVLWVLMTVLFLALYRNRRVPALVIIEGRKY
jgi:membrane protease YdiL (CAAX protease family)